MAHAIPAAPDPSIAAAAPRPDTADAPIQTLKVLITAEEAFPELERLFLTARHHIRASFRVFDLATKLRSTEARAIGDTWLDLVAHTLSRGVEINIVIADFDPIAAADLHRSTWRSVRQFTAAEAIAGDAARLSVKAARHPARVGVMPQMIFWPMAAQKLRHHCRDLAQLTPAVRHTQLRDMPNLRANLKPLTEAHDQPRARFTPPPHLYPVTHHQKLACFDSETLYIGGLDLDERRFDTKDHKRAAGATWHDVQLIVTGPVVADAETHLRGFHAATQAGAAAPKPPASPDFLTTLSQARGFGPTAIAPHNISESLLKAHLQGIKAARRLIYIETQFLRDRRISKALCAAAKARPELRAIIILPAAPEDVAFENNTGPDARFGEYLQARNLRHMRRAFGARLFVGAPVRPVTAPDADADEDADQNRAALHRAPLIYVHAKVSIFDDQSAIVSSANLNGRSLRWDTEAGLRITDAEQITHLRQRVFSHWLTDDGTAAHFDPATAQAAWADTAQENVTRPPERRDGFIVPYDRSAAENFGAPVPAVPEEMV